MKHRHIFTLMLLGAFVLFLDQSRAQIHQNIFINSSESDSELIFYKTSRMKDSVWKQISGWFSKKTGMAYLRSLNAKQKGLILNSSEHKPIVTPSGSKTLEYALMLHTSLHALRPVLFNFPFKKSAGCENVCVKNTPPFDAKGYDALSFPAVSTLSRERRARQGFQFGVKRLFCFADKTLASEVLVNTSDSIVKAQFSPWAYTSFPSATAAPGFQNSEMRNAHNQIFATTVIYHQKQMNLSAGILEWKWSSTDFKTHFALNEFLFKHSDSNTCLSDPLSGVFSQIFTGIAFVEFHKTIEQNIRFAGDNLNQSHVTDLCGKYSLVRLWIQQDPEAYKRTMSELYFNGHTELFDGTLLNVSGHIVAVLNSSAGFDKDDKQNWGLYTEVPNRTDMLLMLALADHFHWKLGSSQPYSNDAHYENNALWAGSTIGSEMRMLRAFGFEVEKYGDHLIGLNKDNKMQLKTAIASGRPVLLLVNSYQLNTVAFAVLERPEPGLFQKNTFGTHWISAAGVVGGHNIVFWEYGAYNAASEDFWNTVCGGVVVTYKAGAKKT